MQPNSNPNPSNFPPRSSGPAIGPSMPRPSNTGYTPASGTPSGTQATLTVFRRQPILRYPRKMRVGKPHKMQVTWDSAMEPGRGLDPMVMVQPIIPGANVTPQLIQQPLSANNEMVFWVTPLNKGKLPSPKVEYYSQGRKVGEQTLYMKANTGRLARWLFVLAFLLPLLIHLMPEPKTLYRVIKKIDLRTLNKTAPAAVLPSDKPKEENKPETPAKSDAPAKSNNSKTDAPAKEAPSKETPKSDSPKTDAPPKGESKTPPPQFLLLTSFLIQDKDKAEPAKQDPSKAGEKPAEGKKDDVASKKEDGPQTKSGRGGRRGGQGDGGGGGGGAAAPAPPALPMPDPNIVIKEVMLPYTGADAVSYWIRNRVEEMGYKTISGVEAESRRSGEPAVFGGTREMFSLARGFEIDGDTAKGEWRIKDYVTYGLYLVEPVIWVVYNAVITLPRTMALGELWLGLILLGLALVVWLLSRPSRVKAKGPTLEFKVA